MTSAIFPEAWDAYDRRELERAIAKLRWRYGPERAALIVRGEDPLTNLDIARWRALGARAAQHG